NIGQCSIVTCYEAKELDDAAWVLASIWLSEFAVTTPAIQRLRNMECLGYSFRVKALPVAPKQRDASDITKLGEVEMNLISYSRAVVAATGRRFKPSRPDMSHCHGALHLGKKSGMK